MVQVDPITDVDLSRDVLENRRLAAIVDRELGWSSRKLPVDPIDGDCDRTFLRVTWRRGRSASTVPIEAA